ncbi:hypothetical protein Caci_5579 [Catenulispora acidiphila DSM 44928]|uniref:Uncharacterized protein n=1 Tax=Catenulispora acidiphila (strain DSM 44928 / JCM 14897 / NBRC 102108 / NRRL B-24433 / ID139908) TaxID=479433 RepID=C7QAW5_CATAD|nr:hypothetical protein Caci_5579 [Catenulispora acidiphila DSM 44928]
MQSLEKSLEDTGLEAVISRLRNHDPEVLADLAQRQLRHRRRRRRGRRERIGLPRAGEMGVSAKYGYWDVGAFSRARPTGFGLPR